MGKYLFKKRQCTKYLEQNEEIIKNWTRSERFHFALA